jgi:ParB family chromosome partitioning protein
MSNLYSNSIFFIEVDKIVPNPYQPRREFDPGPLKDLAESIRQYGILQPLTVSRVERETADGGLVTEYELIAGERRLRASKLAGLSEVPAIIRVGDDSMMKLELAIIENLQREDLNSVERARAFARLVDEFKFNHTQIGQKMGKSREYVSNTIRLLALPQEILDALSMGKINEGHTRPLLMLSSRPEEQATLFKEIQFRKITVREAERIARRIAVDKVRKHSLIPNAELMQIEQQLQESLGTRVHIEPKEAGGKITIDYFSNDDLDLILAVLKKEGGSIPQGALDQIAPVVIQETAVDAPEIVRAPDGEIVFEESPESAKEMVQSLDDRNKDEEKQSEEEIDDLYNLKNFSL